METLRPSRRSWTWDRWGRDPFQLVQVRFLDQHRKEDFERREQEKQAEEETRKQQEESQQQKEIEEAREKARLERLEE